MRVEAAEWVAKLPIFEKRSSGVSVPALVDGVKDIRGLVLGLARRGRKVQVVPFSSMRNNALLSGIVIKCK